MASIALSRSLRNRFAEASLCVRLACTGCRTYCIIFIAGVCLDLSAHTVVADAYVLSLTESLIADNDRMPYILARFTNFHKQLQINTFLPTEVSGWKCLLPAFAERCRDWEHTDQCDYIVHGRAPLSVAINDDPLCSCGRGKSVDTFLSKFPEWRDLAPLVTRIAISPLFAVSYLDQILPSSDLGPELPVTPNSRRQRRYACGKCGGPGKPSLLRCSKCKKIHYCSSSCQKSDWKRCRNRLPMLPFDPYEDDRVIDLECFRLLISRSRTCTNTVILLSFPADHVLLVTFNRPKSLNAMSSQMSQDLKVALEWFDEDLLCGGTRWAFARSISYPCRVVIVTGTGRAFCAGADLKRQAHNRCRKWLRIWRRDGNGDQLRYVVASEDAKFGLPEVKRGVVAIQGGTVAVCLSYSRLTHVLGIPRVTVVSGRQRQQVVPASQVLPAALDFARQIVENSPDAVQATKKGITLTMHYPVDEAFNVNVWSNESARVYKGENIKVTCTRLI
ncbi:enoyl-CoA hydratase [Salix suchowensis]|nr:enoyl-CoA hydratase [Salix suchowensis]